MNPIFAKLQSDSNNQAGQSAGMVSSYIINAIDDASQMHEDSAKLSNVLNFSPNIQTFNTPSLVDSAWRRWERSNGAPRTKLQGITESAAQEPQNQRTGARASSGESNFFEIEVRQNKNFSMVRKYIIENLPDEEHIAAFNEQVTEKAMQALDSGDTDSLKAFVRDWLATAQIHAIPGEAEKIALSIAESESTREQRKEEGVWDWRADREQLLNQ